MRKVRPNGIRPRKVQPIRPPVASPADKTCRHCGSEFTPFPGKRGYIDECPTCLDGGPIVEDPRTPILLAVFGYHPAFTTHVVPRDPEILAAVVAGLWCIECRTQFIATLWPHEEMVVECACPCVCHRKLSA